MERKKLITAVVVIISFVAGLAIGWVFDEIARDREALDVTRDPYSVSVHPSDFVAGVDNPFFPLVPGATLVYDTQVLAPAEHDVVVVTNETKVVLGVECTVVRDTVSVNGEVTEDTFDWYAQDIHGNVWYMGEDSTSYSNGVVTSKGGSWEAGVDGAQPGIIMLADPLSGVTYRQEYKAGEAEDMGTVMTPGETVTVPAGDFTSCIRTKDWSPLEPNDVSYKYYAPGVGLVLETLLDGSERVELTQYSSG
jgi:hypothetical protein